MNQVEVFITYGPRRGQVGVRCNGFIRDKQKYYVVDFNGVREEIDLRYIAPATEKEFKRFADHLSLTAKLNEAKAAGNIDLAKEIIKQIKDNGFGNTKAK